ncbi:D-alanine--D-alanine ligase [Companilactobacillus sp. RD055328]|uniref:D-alanine--D-alanine ligase family protein n=1 Tax=Companilactobacillus sp. RD055328 TaxID=2916634 RepID=UPI001FC8CD77|nr:D-alanine--D-alanine ligase [Companilactobacillus sp. RD055328]GKQ43264.1 D-alanine--D-alanine ligase [Companilactobacillus sp. RD055328]
MKIVVLSGGRSTERNVSLSSGARITNALRSKGHKVAYVDSFLGVDANSDAEVDALFTTDPEDESKLIISDEVLTTEKINALRTDGTRGLFGKNVMRVCQAADIVYMGLHGEDGENGKVQAMLDLNEVKYTGSGTLASGLAMDKKFSKEIFFQNNILTAKYFATKNSEIKSSDLEFDFPMVVKPANGGSSVGTSIVRDESELKSSVQEALKFDGEALIEEFIEGREFSIGLIDQRVFPAVEIVVDTGWYDFEHKFIENNVTHFITPPENLDPAIHKQMQDLALKTFEALGMVNYGRVDVLLNDKGAYVIEANSLPGMTPLSLLPREAAADGVDYADLCEMIINSKLAWYENNK